MKLRAWLAALLLFVGGMAVGSVVTIRIGQRLMRHAFSAPADAPAPIDRTAKRMERQLGRALDLSPGQQTQVDAAIEQSTHAIKVLRVETGQKLQDILNHGVAAAAAPLTPGQRAQLYELARKRMDGLGLVLAPPANP